MELFLDDLLNKAGLNSLSEEFKLSYKDKLYQQLVERIGLLAMQRLPDDKIDDYKNLVSEKTQQKELDVFLRQHVPDFENFVKEAMIKFGQEFVDITAKNQA